MFYIMHILIQLMIVFCDNQDVCHNKESGHSNSSSGHHEGVQIMECGYYMNCHYHSLHHIKLACR